MSEPRDNCIYLYVGNRKTGKTDLIKNIIDVMPQPKVLIVDTFDNPVWRTMKTWNHPEWDSRIIPTIQPEQVKLHQYGLCRVYSDDTDMMQGIIKRDCANSSTIIEDASRYFDPRLTKAQKAYLLNSKQKNVDLHLVFHFLSDIAPQLIKLANYITIKKTGEKTYDKDKYHHPDFAEAFKRVSESPNRFEAITLMLQ